MTTREEDKLLEKMRMRYLDGIVGDQLKMPSGALMWYEIRDGVPVKCIQWTRSSGKNPYIAEKWDTTAKKLVFLQKYGFLRLNHKTCGI